MDRKTNEDRARLLIDSLLVEKRIARLVREIRDYDETLFKHVDNVAFITAQVCYMADMSKSQIKEFVTAALLHDIGKTHIDKEILCKQGFLTDEEYFMAKQHVAIGEKILREEGFSDNIIRYVSEHHEREDGTGYPKGLTSKQISEGGKLLAAVDAYEALTAIRSYGREHNTIEAVTILKAEKNYDLGYIMDITLCEAL